MTTMVPTVRTPTTPEAMARELIRQDPGLPRKAVALALAQLRWESANGQAVNNHNPGNIAAQRGYSGQAWGAPWVTDESHPLHGEWLAGRAPSGFRAYASLADGVRDYLRAVTHWMPEVRRSWSSGDPDTVFAAIRLRYTPDRMSSVKEAAARENYASLYRASLGIPEVAALPPLPAPEGSSLAGGAAAGGGILAILAAVGWSWVRSRRRRPPR